MSEVTKAKTSIPIGLERLVIWPLIEDSRSNLEYGEAYEFDKILMSCQDDPSVVGEPIYADNVEVDYVTVSNGGKLTLGITLLTSGERAMLYGELVKKGTNITNIDNLSGYIGLACMTKCSDKKYNLKKYFKVKFIPGSESNETATKSGVKYATQQITGEYSSLVHNGDSRAVRYKVDLTEDADIVNEWFIDAKYIGPEESTSGTETTTTGNDNPDG